MQESNIYFPPNTYNYGGIYTGDTINKFDARKGNEEFFRQVMDYGALIKLKAYPRMYGTLSSGYYVASRNQLLVVDPKFSAVMLNHRERDPVIEADNAIKDAEYGYQEKNDFYPLLEEIVIDDTTISYADEILGKWMLTDQPLDSNRENPFGLYIKQRIAIDESTDTVSAKEAGFEDIDDVDPYYYQYEEAAGKEKRKIGDIDKARLYEEKYGSIFRIFEEVEQQDIIEAPASQYTFVNAGPGTGKTYTLMKKIIQMIEQEEIDPEEILVLCFTNAAVNEIKARIKKYSEEQGDRAFINVDVRTFHSFSWLLISQANELFYDRTNYQYIDISKLNYDQSIRKATAIIRAYGDEVFGGCSHLIVDEIQDLTNERASLVISMIQECMKNRVGFTVLGDSCQAIYDYTDEDTFFEMKSDRFYKHIFSELFDKGQFYKLEKNRRQNEWLISVGGPLRQAILSGKKDDVRKAIALVRNAVSNYVTGAFSVKVSKHEIDMLEENGTVCLMCRNNAQVLATSSNLRKRGIKHIINAYNEFEYLSEWIGKAFGLFLNP